MALRFDADIHLLLLERTEFWQAKLNLQQLPQCETSAEVAVRAHNLLEAYLRRDATLHRIGCGCITVGRISRVPINALS